MTTIKDAASTFLAHRRVAVTGVSREAKGHGGNVVYTRLRDRGYEVFPVNPNATEVEGDPCFPDLRSIPGGVEAVVVATRPEVAEKTVRECADLGIGHVWMHRGPGPGSVSEAAAAYGREQGSRSSTAAAVHVRPDRGRRPQGDALRPDPRRQGAEGGLTRVRACDHRPCWRPADDRGALASVARSERASSRGRRPGGRTAATSPRCSSA